MTDRKTLVAELRRTGSRVVDSLLQLTPSQFEEGRYENGWNARQILAHMASVEWTYPKLLEVAAAPPTERGESRAPAARGGFDAYNARQVQARDTNTVAELIEEFARNRAATVSAVENTDESLLAKPIRSAGGATGTLGDVLRQVAVEHVEQHLEDLLGPD